ncbi:uncharacterized protein LOC121728712 [Aricia agestis]|uniref:uncharacterized protein LOC121728712 n=1 Tax=Aricia agestis TaxID=91739 RepID=UPI001C20C452|nr:uncharacterized protein LOC121728712 [Aricia agestis]
MSSDEYCVRNIYSYSRKSYKNDANSSIEAFTERRGVEVPDNGAALIPVCSCDMDSKGIIEDMLHKKCPIKALAYQQRQRVVDETDKILYENTTYSRSLYDFLIFFGDVVIGENRRVCALFLLIAIAFVIGILFGSATCGTHLRKFNSPVFACIDHLLAIDSRKTSDDTAIY